MNATQVEAAIAELMDTPATAKHVEKIGDVPRAGALLGEILDTLTRYADEDPRPMPAPVFGAVCTLARAYAVEHDLLGPRTPLVEDRYPPPPVEIGAVVTVRSVRGKNKGNLYRGRFIRYNAKSGRTTILLGTGGLLSGVWVEETATDEE